MFGEGTSQPPPPPPPFFKSFFVCSPALVCSSESLGNLGVSFPPPCSALPNTAGLRKIFRRPVLLISLHCAAFFFLGFSRMYRSLPEGGDTTHTALQHREYRSAGAGTAWLEANVRMLNRKVLQIHSHTLADQLDGYKKDTNVKFLQPSHLSCEEIQEIFLDGPAIFMSSTVKLEMSPCRRPLDPTCVYY